MESPRWIYKFGRGSPISYYLIGETLTNLGENCTNFNTFFRDTLTNIFTHTSYLCKVPMVYTVPYVGKVFDAGKSITRAIGRFGP